MARNRYILHVKHKDDFAAWAQARGWELLAPIGPYEVLRMKHPDFKALAIVHRRDDTDHGGDLEHFTVWGQSETLAHQFIAERRRARNRVRDEARREKWGLTR